MFTRVKTLAEIEAMRESGRMLAGILTLLKNKVAPGVAEIELAHIAEQELKAYGAAGPFKGYRAGGGVPFPSVICISTNDQVVHGVPSEYVLQNGDIVSLDFGVQYRGMITDSAITLPVGNASAEALQLIGATRNSLEAGIAAVHGGIQTGDIGAAVQAVLDAHRYGIVRELAGHGVGHAIHEDPNIVNYGRAGKGPTLQAGMTVAIEPMATLGGERIKIEDDGWTITTLDGSLSAHFEHTILITDDGAEILTA